MPTEFYADYHTHTWFSHGRGTIEENVRAAIARKLKTIAITDHGFAHPLIGMNASKAYQMRRIVDEMNRRYQRDIRVLLGVESNVISPQGAIDLPDRLASLFEVLAVGLHRLVFMSPLPSGVHMNTVNNLRWVSAAMAANARRINTGALTAAMERYPVDIITHAGYCYPVDLPEAAAVAARTGTLLEINAAHAFPTAAGLRAAASAGVRFVAGSDAHHPSRVGCMEAAARIIEEAGLPPGRVVNIAGNPEWVFKSHESGGAS